MKMSNNQPQDPEETIRLDGDIEAQGQKNKDSCWDWMTTFKSPTKLKIFSGCCICIILIFIIIASLTGYVLNKVIDSSVKSQLTMTSDNIDVWGSVPGKYDIKILRNLTLFTMLNPNDLYSSAQADPSTYKPIKVKQSESLLFYERHTTTDVTFNDDSTKVNFSQTLSYDLAMEQKEYDRISNQEITIPNIYALGAWDSAGKQLNTSQMAFYTLGSILTSMTIDDDIFYEALALGVNAAYIEGATFEELYNRDFEPAGIDKPTAQRIYSDPVFGWSKNTTVKRWGQAIVRGVEGTDSHFLKNYFGLTYQQMGQLVKGRISKAVELTQLLLKDTYNCPKNSPISCNSQFLAAIQLGRQDVTLLSPPPVPRFDTLGQTNVSVTGFTEFSYYYKEFFLKHISNDPVYQNIELSTAQSLSLFAFVPEGSVAISKTTLVHPVHMDNLIRAGESFRTSKDLDEFKAITDQLQLPSTACARVLFEWSTYLAKNFSSAGWFENSQVATKAMWAAKGLYTVYGDMLEHVKPILLRTSLWNALDKDSVSCAKSVQASIYGVAQTKIVAFCGGNNQVNWSKDNLKTLLSFCNNPSTANYNKNQNNLFTFTYLELNLLCDDGDDSNLSLGSYIRKAENTLVRTYKCPNYPCSIHNLAMMQFINSTVSLNPLSNSDYPKSNTLSEWFPKIFPQGFELPYMLEKTGYTGKLTPLTLDQANIAFSFDNLFSTLPIARGLKENFVDKNDTVIKTRFFFSDPLIFDRYVNFVALNVYLGGVTYTAKFKDIMFGFTPDIIQKVIDTPALEGGDPSTPKTIAMNENNTKLVQSRFTGKDDIDNVGVFDTIDGLQYISMKRQFWDGYKVKNQSYNPWGAEVLLKGGDGSGFKPRATKKTVPKGYVTDLYRYFHSVYQKDVTKDKGLKTYRYVSDPKDQLVSAEAPYNKNYYQYVYDGILNETTVQRAPIFVSNLNFGLSKNTSVRDQIEIYDKDNNLVKHDPLMDGYMDLEPISGVPAEIVVNFQINLDLSKDSLLDTRPHLLVPAFQVRRNVKLTPSQITTIFGPIIQAEWVIFLAPIVGGFLAFCCLVIFLFILIKNKRLCKKKSRASDGMYYKITQEPGPIPDSMKMSVPDSKGRGSLAI